MLPTPVSNCPDALGFVFLSLVQSCDVLPLLLWLVVKYLHQENPFPAFWHHSSQALVDLHVHYDPIALCPLTSNLCPCHWKNWAPHARRLSPLAFLPYQCAPGCTLKRDKNHSLLTSLDFNLAAFCANLSITHCKVTSTPPYLSWHRDYGAILAQLHPFSQNSETLFCLLPQRASVCTWTAPAQRNQFVSYAAECTIEASW